jgi:nitrite reductase/ring-hydroxylating ferredoxin subunit
MTAHSQQSANGTAPGSCDARQADPAGLPPCAAGSAWPMQMISRLEHASSLDGVVSAGQRVARLIRPGRVRDVLHGVWLGHPLHPALVQGAAGTWLSASIVDLAGEEQAARLLTAVGLAAAAPAALAGAVDWSEQHEQQMRVGVVHAAGNAVAMGVYGASLATTDVRRGRLLRLAGLAVLAGSASLGGRISFRMAGGANHAEAVPHLIEPGWHHLMPAADLPDGKAVRRTVGEVPVVAVRDRGAVRVLAGRCSHMDGPLSDGELTAGADGACLTCPWHGSVFRLADGSVARGPATAPQPSFVTREVGGAIQVCLPGAG